MTQLHQFTPEERSRGGHAGTAALRRKREELDKRSLTVWQVVDETQDLSPAALSAAMDGIRAVAEGLSTVVPEDALDLQRIANATEILHRIHRLASGQSTSNNAHASLTDDERAARLARLRGDAPPSPSE